MVLADTTTTQEQDKALIKMIAKYNEDFVLCFCYVFGALIVLNLNHAEELEIHNQLLKSWRDKGAGCRYFFNGIELE